MGTAACHVRLDVGRHEAAPSASRTTDLRESLAQWTLDHSALHGPHPQRDRPVRVCIISYRKVQEKNAVGQAWGAMQGAGGPRGPAPIGRGQRAPEGVSRRRSRSALDVPGPAATAPPVRATHRAPDTPATHTLDGAWMVARHAWPAWSRAVTQRKAARGPETAARRSSARIRGRRRGRGRPPWCLGSSGSAWSAGQPWPR